MRTLPQLLRERVERGKLAEALVAARELARLEPTGCEGLRVLAGLRAQLGDRSALHETLAMALRLCPGSATLAADYGRSLLALGCASEAVSWLERAVLLDPWDLRARAHLGVAREVVAADWSEADSELHALEQEVGIYVGSATATQSRALSERWREALRRLRPASSASLAESPDAESEIRHAEFYRLGRELGVDGAEARALAHVRRAIELRFTSSEALVLLGSLEMTQEPPDPAAAETAFLAALAVDDTRPLAGAWSGLFFAHVASGRYRAALDDAARYLDIVPDDREFRSLRDDLARQLALAAPIR